MLSKKMVGVLLKNSPRETRSTYAFTDGRTVRALQNRRLIKHVSFNQSVHAWQYRYTKHGVKVARALLFIDTNILMEIVK